MTCPRSQNHLVAEPVSDFCLILHPRSYYSGSQQSSFVGVLTWCPWLSSETPSKTWRRWSCPFWKEAAPGPFQDAGAYTLNEVSYGKSFSGFRTKTITSFLLKFSASLTSKSPPSWERGFCTEHLPHSDCAPLKLADGKETVQSLEEATNKGKMMETFWTPVYFRLLILLWSSKGSKTRVWLDSDRLQRESRGSNCIYW